MKKIKPEDLTCIIDRIESQKIILKIVVDREYQELIVPRRYLPKDCKEGGVYHIKFYTDNELKKNKKDMAYQILEEILKGENHGSK